MILQALKGYYDRLFSDQKRKNGTSKKEISAFGFSRNPIHFALIIDTNGKLLDVHDLREPHETKTKSGKVKKTIDDKELIVPLPVKRAPNIAPSFLWDNTGYVLGADLKGKPARTANQFDAFKKLCHEIGDGLDDEGMQAVLKFLDNWDPSKAREQKLWDEMSGKNVVFKLDKELQYIHERPTIKSAWLEYHRNQLEKNIEGICIITGEKSHIAKLHSSIKGVRGRGAKSSGASIVAFNLDSFCSYGKDEKQQSYNAPVSNRAAFEYVTALNYLLSKDSRQKVKIGDATTVFWAERDTSMETIFKRTVEPGEDADAQRKLHVFLETVRKGKKLSKPEIDEEVKFFILGLSPNASRISIRFWYQTTVGELSRKIEKHFSDIEIEQQSEKYIEPKYPGISRLLLATAVQWKYNNINPKLAGAFAYSVISGTKYPQTMLSSVINRIRADHSINYPRASIIKGVLTRNFKLEVLMSLDKENKNVAYLLGRLFAILEKAQKDAQKDTQKDAQKEAFGQDIGATIKKGFYSSASATPRQVFPQLLRLAQHHIDKAKKYGYIDDMLIEEVIQDIQEFPAHLSLQDQGLFAIGFYHQRNDFFKKKGVVSIDKTKESSTQE